MSKFGEVVSFKPYHPGVGDFVTQEEYEKLQAEFNAPANVEAQIEQALQHREETATAKEVKPKGHPLKGKKLFPVGDGSHRKTWSKGYSHFKILLDHPGCTYEEFIKLGGAPMHLNWDIDHGKVEVK